MPCRSTRLTRKGLGACLLRLRKPQSTCVGGANLQRKLPERVLKKALFLSAIQAETTLQRERNKEFESSSSGSSQKPNNNFAQASKEADNTMKRLFINTSALLAILTAAVVHQVGSAPLENETQERTNICGSISGEFRQRWFISFDRIWRG